MAQGLLGLGDYYVVPGTHAAISGHSSWTTIYKNKAYLSILEFDDLGTEKARETLCSPEQWDAVQRLSERRGNAGPGQASSM